MAGYLAEYCCKQGISDAHYSTVVDRSNSCCFPMNQHIIINSIQPSTTITHSQKGLRFIEG
ncbi:unnamed protein product [Fusarium graminearum]|nr:unnamed protein product [Fusarium graminearum]CAG1963098.1 unnamed protein product [Fusarium graminearum]CAG2005854.1 unnamed protein product [Fusarium graminearum]VTO84643.1 unnamed protein product [Fusarium graminearum]